MYVELPSSGKKDTDNLVALPWRSGLRIRLHPCLAEDRMSSGLLRLSEATSGQSADSACLREEESWSQFFVS